MIKYHSSHWCEPETMQWLFSTVFLRTASFGQADARTRQNILHASTILERLGGQ